jgi:DNA repair protein RecN (Recombination protein N)
MAPLSALGEAAAGRIDLHGQHSHQSLLSPAAQRAGLDAFAHIDLEPVAQAAKRVRAAVDALRGLGGDAATRAREHDMLGFQVGEIDGANLGDADEDDRLAAEEERLANARAHREAAEGAGAALSGDGGVTDILGALVASLAGHPPMSAVHQRLQAAAIELTDVASELRALAEGLDDDPSRLAWLRERRQLLRQLRRKYGEALADVIDYGESARRRLAELDSYDQQAARLEAERDQAVADLALAETTVGRQRRAAGPRLASAIEEQLRTLAMPKARIDVRVGDDRAGDEVTLLLGANPGEPLLPLTKVASGGELARTMLAVRLVLGPGARDGAGSTLVFDEVDAGIGGEAALAVGAALAALARHHQVLVVTHLAQVAAFADQQLAVHKDEIDGRTVATVHRLDETERVVELTRMLSGQPDSVTGRRHAEELRLVARQSVARGRDNAADSVGRASAGTGRRPR